MSYIDELHTKWPLWSDGDWCHEACAEVDRLRADLAAARADAERERIENGAIHGKIGLMAERLLCISNNLPTDETLARLEACFKGNALRIDRMEMTHSAFDADMVDFMHRVQDGEVTCIRAAQVIEAKLAALTAERDELRKDKERLDWVQAQTVSGFLWGFRRFPQTGGGGMYQLIQFVKDESLSESVRSAIDAACATPTGGAGENAGARREET